MVADVCARHVRRHFSSSCSRKRVCNIDSLDGIRNVVCQALWQQCTAGVKPRPVHSKGVLHSIVVDFGALSDTEKIR